LQNRTYLGEVVHKEQSHPGEHTPIIDQPLWDAVQAQLASNTTERSPATAPAGRACSPACCSTPTATR
jgi:site-specific DNA recombinase